MSERIKINPRPIWRIGKGHGEHRSGSGVHADRRTRRTRTRADATRRAMEGK